MSNLEIEESSFSGCILGTAVGDALGLPLENLSARRIGRLYPVLDRYNFWHGRGIISDDTEHACLVAQSLIEAGSDLAVFSDCLARRLRLWLLGIPLGIGWATLRSCLKLCAGMKPEHSGVYSAGNGPAMRAALIGLRWGHDPDRLVSFVRAATRISHTDPKAEAGALTIAGCAYWGAQTGGGPATELPPRIEGLLETAVRTSFNQTEMSRAAAELLKLLEAAVQSAAAGEGLEEFAVSQGWCRGVSGYVYHTVPAAVQAWLGHPVDIRAALIQVLACGGDTDTVGAIVGALTGATGGIAIIPAELLRDLCSWPRSVDWLTTLGTELAAARQADRAGQPPRLPVSGLVLHNSMSAISILVQIGRRALPPW